jgi:hypothetical protein
MNGGGIFCDIEKASNCINHDTVLSKMGFCGITDKKSTIQTLS